MARENFALALDRVLGHEGGPCDDPRDMGGRTNCGITHFVYDAYRVSKGLPPIDVFKIGDSERDEIYRTQYWDAVRGDSLPGGIDYVVFDGAVNSGAKQSIKWLQRALGSVKIDGQIGKTTLAAVARCPDQLALIVNICEARREFLRHLHSFSVFGRGWMKRVDDVQATALALASGATLPPVNAEVTRQAKALRENARRPPSTTRGDVALTAGGVGLATAAASKNSVDQSAPLSPASPASTALPSHAAQTPTPHSAASAANAFAETHAPATATPGPAAAPATAHTKIASALSSGAAIGIETSEKMLQTVSSSASDAYPLSFAVLTALFVSGLFMTWSSRRARARRVDALGESLRTRTVLKPIKLAKRKVAPPSLKTSVMRGIAIWKTWPARLLCAVWVIATVGINAVALAKLLQGFGLDHEAWHGPFVWLSHVYDAHASQALSGTSSLVSQEYGVTLPKWAAPLQQWLVPIFVLYVSSASAFVVGSKGLLPSGASEDFLGDIGFKNWIFLLPTFVLDAIRYRVVTRFAQQHTLVFIAYLLASCGSYFGAQFINDRVPLPSAEQVAHTAEMVTQEYSSAQLK